jgi:uncharacterized protein
VIALDTNILIYALREDAPFHQPAARCVAELAEGRAMWAIPWPCLYEDLRTLLTTSRVTGARVHDARIAALCLQHGVRELWSADRDFGRFPSLNVVNPLVQ